MSERTPIANDVKSPQSEEQVLTVDEALSLAVALHQKGQLTEAEAIYRRILGSLPEHPDALHFLGVLRHQLGQTEEAMPLIRRAVELSPGYADAHCNLGNVLKQCGRFDEAEQCYLKTLELEPGHADAHNNLGVVFKVQGRLEEAAREYEQAIALAPDHADAHHNLGNVRKRQGRLAEALGYYRQAIALNPHHGDARKFLGMALRAAGKQEEAVAVFRDWVDCEPQNPVARHLLAACTGEDAPPRAADAYVETVFDRLADTFDEHLRDLEYRAPELVAEAVARVTPPPAGNLDVLDAGCGTGLCAGFLRPYARRLTGVDLSGGMLARAERLRLYDALVKAELTAFLGENPDCYDLVVSADTLCYFGDVREVLRVAGLALRAGGLLVFTAELLEAGAGSFRLAPHGRYIHGKAYLDEALALAGLATEAVERSVLRREAGEPVEGLVVTARRKTLLPRGAQRCCRPGSSNP